MPAPAGERLSDRTMKRILVFLKQWALVVAIITGALGHSVFSHLSFLSPYLLIVMLLFTFCGMSLRTVRIHRLHVMLLALQMAGSLVLYWLLLGWNDLAAQTVGLMATYVFLGTFSSIVAAPLLVPMMAPGHVDMPFFASMMSVFFKVGPILFVPFFCALALQSFAPRVCESIVRKSFVSYYLWVAMILILMGSTFDMLLSPGRKDVGAEIVVAACGVVVCMLQFLVGKLIGSLYHRRISAGQALAQKNLMLAMWLAFQYFDPMVVVGLAAYSVTQNVFNATQLWLKGRMDGRVQERLHAYHEQKHHGADGGVK